MASDHDQTESIAARVAEAAGSGTALELRGSGSKAFYGRSPRGELLDVSGHRGVVSYEPSELVVTARAGTPLAELEQALADGGQVLPFEPPRFSGGGTLGGAVAAGLSGPRRPFAGAVRDFVLGTRIVNGRGQVLRFGGEVIKNVAGYDLSRLAAGALGTLGVLLEVSLRLLPRSEAQACLTLDAPQQDLYRLTEGWLRAGVPVSAAAHDGERLLVRLSGSESAVADGSRHIGGSALDDGAAYWNGLRDHELPFFAGDTPLWRLALPPAAPLPALEGKRLLDWGGRQCWLRSDAPADTVRAEARRLGGHAELFRGSDRDGEVFQPLDDALLGIHRRLRESMDPRGILNPGRLYSTL